MCPLSLCPRLNPYPEVAWDAITRSPLSCQSHHLGSVIVRCSSTHWRTIFKNIGAKPYFGGQNVKTYKCTGVFRFLGGAQLPLQSLRLCQHGGAVRLSQITSASIVSSCVLSVSVTQGSPSL